VALLQEERSGICRGGNEGWSNTSERTRAVLNELRGMLGLLLEDRSFESTVEERNAVLLHDSTINKGGRNQHYCRKELDKGGITAGR
jgi:hypothetical protein